MNLDEGHNGQSIEAAVGETLTLRLPENPTTGFRWALCGDQPGLETIEDGFESGGSSPGASGVRILRYRVVRPGDIDLHLQNRQTWQPDQPASELRIRVRVR